MSSRAEPESHVETEAMTLDTGSGCYYVRIIPTIPRAGMDYFHGTIRIESIEDTRICSGDIYRHLEGTTGPETSFGAADAIPIFPRDQYSCYLETAVIEEASPDADEFSVELKLFAYESKSAELLDCGKRMLRLARAEAPKALIGTSFGERFYRGEMRAAGGRLEGVVEMGRVSETYFRRVSLEIDCMPDCSAPLDNGSGVEWRDVFENIGWKLDALRVEDVPETELRKAFPSVGRVWSTSQLHAAMETFRSPDADLDQRWHYHLLCVPQIAGFGRGVMYDGAVNEAGSPPREGAAIASDYRFPEAEDVDCDARESRLWGYTQFAGDQFSQASALYFRTAVHEVGHLFGLGHNQRDDGFMTASNIVARNNSLRRVAGLFQKWGNAACELKILESGTKDFRMMTEKAYEILSELDEGEAEEKAPYFRQKHAIAKHIRDTHAFTTIDAAEEYDQLIDSIRAFPDNIQWQFGDLDLRHLRHGPDAAVRPGSRCGTGAIEQGDETRPEQASGMELELVPLEPTFPLGAPVRVFYRIRNTTHWTSRPTWLQAPGSLALKAGCVSFEVRSPSGRRTEIRALMTMEDQEDVPVILGPGASRSHAATLFANGSECAFPEAGDYEIRARVEWTQPVTEYGTCVEPPKFHLSRATSVRVEAPTDSKHAIQARDLISRNDLQRGIVIRAGVRNEKTPLEAYFDSIGSESPLCRHFQATFARAAFERNRYGSAGEVVSELKHAADLITESMVLTPAEITCFLDWIAENETSLGADGVRAKKALLGHAKTVRKRIPRAEADEQLSKLLDRFGIQAKFGSL